MAKVMIDVGHGGSDPGSSGNGIVEKDINLKVGLALKEYLSKYELQIRMTRDVDITLSNDARVEMVNRFDPDLCVSVHHNAASATTARGAEVIHAHYDEYDDKLANAILDNLTLLGMPKRRAFTKLNSRGDDWYFMIRRIWDSNTAAIIVEGGFVTNSADAEMLKDENYLVSEAAAIGKAIVEFLGLTPKTENWWNKAMQLLKTEGIIEAEHNGNTDVTWGELAVVIAKLLEKMKA